jgi:hypothetical protein
MNPSWHDLTLKLGIGTPNVIDIIDALIRKELSKSERITIDKFDLTSPIIYNLNSGI